MRSTWVTVPALLVTMLASQAGIAGVVADGPEGVLDAYSRVFDGAGVDALETLLASDYDWVVVNPPEVQLVSRADVIKLTRNMLASDRLKGVDLSFDGGSVAQGAGEDDWLLKNVRATLAVSMASDEGGESDVQQVNSSCMTFYVRKVPGTDSEYEIYREVNFEGVGCEDE